MGISNQLTRLTAGGGLALDSRTQEAAESGVAPEGSGW
jgi:hypothetical protein